MDDLFNCNGPCDSTAHLKCVKKYYAAYSKEWKCNKCVDSESKALVRKSPTALANKEYSSDVAVCTSKEEQFDKICKQFDAFTQSMTQFTQHMSKLTLVVTNIHEEITNIKEKQSNVDDEIVKLKKLIALKDAKLNSIEEQINQLKKREQ